MAEENQREDPLLRNHPAPYPLELAERLIRMFSFVGDTVLDPVPRDGHDVAGGKHLDGFTQICRDLLIEAGLPEAHIFWQDRKELPGFYRAEKNWDLVVVVDGSLLAVVEFKAQVGPSFGNNFNNRTEEALGERDRSLGRVSRRRVSSVRSSLARICVYPRRLPQTAAWGGIVPLFWAES